MTAPDTIYLQYVDGDDDFYSDTTWCAERIHEDDIVYDRRKTCVWENGGEYITPHGWRHSTVDLVVRYFKVCPYCGGHVELEELKERYAGLCDDLLDYAEQELARAEQLQRELRLEVDEAKGFLGEGGDNTLKGRIESVLYERADFRRERDEAIALLRRWAAGPMEEDREVLHRETATLIGGQDD